jgi:hypothetical protein
MSRNDRDTMIELLIQALMLVEWHDCQQLDRRDTMIQRKLERVIAALEGE